MAPRVLLLAVVAAGLGGGGGACRSRVPAADLATPEPGLESFGSSRARLDFRRLAPIRFLPGEWSDGVEPEVGLRAVAMEVGSGGRVWLLGVGEEDVPLEHGRQLALARALSVRKVLIDGGADPARILVSGVAASEAVGLTGREDSGPRVECAIIR